MEDLLKFIANHFVFAFFIYTISRVFISFCDALFQDLLNDKKLAKRKSMEMELIAKLKDFKRPNQPNNNV